MRVVPPREGRVYLVGAGPGDPDLITLRGARCLQSADVVIYDRLVTPRLLELAPAHAELIFVGKKGGHYTFDQQQINGLLVKYAQKGRQVVRLKGGDPFLFGRGGEEAVYLAEKDIPFEVVPGVTSALGVLTAAGIPATHRGLSSSVTILTGHSANQSAQDWEQARSADTLVVLMPLGNLRQIVSQLILHGWALDTPAALIESGTLENERRLDAPLRRIVCESAEAGLKSPTLLVVGEVVRLSQTLYRQARGSVADAPTAVAWERKKSS